MGRYQNVTLFLLPVAAVKLIPWEMSALTPAGLMTFLFILKELESSQLLGCGGVGCSFWANFSIRPSSRAMYFRVHESLLKIRRKRMNF